MLYWPPKWQENENTDALNLATFTEKREPEFRGAGEKDPIISHLIAELGPTNMARKRWLLPLTVTCLVSLQSWADFESAAEVYRMRDYAAAFEQFLPLAEQGDHRAQTVIAMMYKFGEAVKQDKLESFKWYSKAAEQGYPPAQFQVGEMYATGVGVEMDMAKAIAWLSRAADAGFGQANDRLSELNAGGRPAEPAREDPIPWSQAWNLRLPDDIRYGSAVSPPSKTEPTREVYRVQLGAMKSLASANRLWHIVRDGHTDLFQGLEPVFKATRPGVPVLYRIQTGPFDSISAAGGFCSRLIARGLATGCLPIPADDNSDP